MVVVGPKPSLSRTLRERVKRPRADVLAQEEPKHGRQDRKRDGCYLNNFSKQPADELVEELLRQHRTLQQCFSRFCLRWLERLAEAPHGFDLRNEASVELAREIVKIDPRKRALPFI